MSLPNHQFYSSVHLKLFALNTRRGNLIKLLKDYEDYVDNNYRVTRRRGFNKWRKRNLNYQSKWRKENKSKVKEYQRKAYLKKREAKK